MRNARHGFSSLKGSNQLQSHRHHPQLPVQIVVELSVMQHVTVGRFEDSFGQ
jgi:hypothetical protein